MPKTTRRTPRLSKAALVLAGAGISVREVGRELDLHNANVSRQLRGEARPHPELIPTIARLGGPELADQVAAAIEAKP